MKFLIYVLILINFTVVFSQNTEKTNLNTEENSFVNYSDKLVNQLTFREIKKLLTNHKWRLSDEKQDVSCSFFYNFLSLKKGVYVIYDENENKKVSEIKFTLKKKNDTLKVYFNNSKKGKTIETLTKLELVIDGKKYNFVRYCW